MGHEEDMQSQLITLYSYLLGKETKRMEDRRECGNFFISFLGIFGHTLLLGVIQSKEMFIYKRGFAGRSHSTQRMDLKAV